MFSISTNGIVNGTLYLLIAFSVITWAIIMFKTLQHWYVARANRAFLEAFWGASDLTAAAALRLRAGPAAHLAHTGFGLLQDNRVASQDLAHLGDSQGLLERRLREQLHRERRTMESGLVVLASIGSTAPFIGLFGTVWGIMHALRDITKAGSASLDVVAGPIGEALISTAIGIAVAIPAVLAYNFFLRRQRLSFNEIEDFATDFLKVAGLATGNGAGQLANQGGTH